MNQWKTPLYDAIVSFANKNPYSFHVPGHKNGRYFSKHGQAYFADVLRMDVTELNGLDDLHQAEACIDEAQQLLTNLYGTKKSYFLINGSTVGNIAMILASCFQGDTVFVQRNAHKSIMNGIELVGAKPVFLRTVSDDQTQIPVGIAIETLMHALEQYPNTKVLILTHPNYYGMASDLQSIISLAHEKGMIVLVDEAHGAHFCLGSPFPTSALAYGADVVVHSAHKTLPAMTMGSYLHINSNRVKKETIERYLGMLQSSSPSYPIMASLDLARYELAQVDKEELVPFLEKIRDQFHGIPQVAVITTLRQDPLKITLQTRCKLSGYELQSLFEERGIYTEMADREHVLFILPLCVDAAYMKAVETVREVLAMYEIIESQRVTIENEPLCTELVLQPHEQVHYNTVHIPLSKASGRIAAETIVPYPPGIPLIMRGERITDLHIEQINNLVQAGARFQGNIKNPTVYEDKER